MKLTDNQQLILNELAKNNGSIDDYKTVLTSVLGTSKAGLSRVVNNLKKEYMIEVIDEYTLTLTKVGASYVTVEVTEEDIQAAEITKIEKDLYFDINAARARLPRGYQVEKFDNGYEVVNREGKIVLNETEIPQEDLRGISLNEKYAAALIQNAFFFLRDANEEYAKLQALKAAENKEELFERVSEVIAKQVAEGTNTVYTILGAIVDANLAKDKDAAQDILSNMSCEDLIEITNIEKVGRATIVRIDLVNHDDVIDDNMVVDEAVGVPRLELLPEEIEDLKKFNAEYYELSHDDKLRLTIAYDMFNISELLPPGYRCTREENKIVIRNKFEEIVDHIEAGHYLMIDRDWVQAQYDKAFNIVDRVNEKCKYLGIFQEEVNE